MVNLDVLLEILIVNLKFEFVQRTHGALVFQLILYLGLPVPLLGESIHNHN